MRHSYLTVVSRKPTVSEIEVGELVINLKDKTIWTKNPEGVVIKIGDS